MNRVFVVVKYYESFYTEIVYTSTNYEKAKKVYDIEDEDECVELIEMIDVDIVENYKEVEGYKTKIVELEKELEQTKRNLEYCNKVQIIQHQKIKKLEG